MEVQLTDFENAAFTAFVVLVTRVLLVFDLCFLIPLSKVDDNMKRAHCIDAVKTQKFWWRPDVMLNEGQCPLGCKYEEMTMRDIVGGCRTFPGLVPLVYAYLDHIQCDGVSFARIDQYLSFILARASGDLLTPASWMRNFVHSHPEYKKDSVVTQGIAYDLMCACDEIGRGVRRCEELHGDVVIEPISNVQAYEIHLANRGNMASRNLLELLHKRASEGNGPGSTPSRPLSRRDLDFGYDLGQSRDLDSVLEV